MIDISSLPKMPEEALAEIIERLIPFFPISDVTIGANITKNIGRANMVRTLRKLALISSERVSDDEIKTLVVDALNYEGSDALKTVGAKLDGIQSLMFAAQFDQHFISASDIEDFDSTNLDEDDKFKIREQLAKARQLTETADYLSDDHKRRVLHRISQVDNELFKEIVGFKAFIVAGYEASSLIKQFGEDAKPLAKAIETARTITEKKVDGYQRIEADERPRQITGPNK